MVSLFLRCHLGTVDASLTNPRESSALHILLLMESTTCLATSITTISGAHLLDHAITSFHVWNRIGSDHASLLVGSITESHAK